MCNTRDQFSKMTKQSLTMYATNVKVSHYRRWKLIKLQREIDEFTITVRDFNISLLEITGPSRQKISKDVVELNTINQLDINDIYRLLHPTRAEWIFFSSSHKAFTKIDHILSNRTLLNKFKVIENNMSSQTMKELN